MGALFKKSVALAVIAGVAIAGIFVVIQEFAIKLSLREGWS